MPTEELHTIMDDLGVPAKMVQAEFIEVNSDLRREHHYHKKAHAFCIILGEQHGFADPSEDAEKSLSASSKRN